MEYSSNCVVVGAGRWAGDTGLRRKAARLLDLFGWPAPYRSLKNMGSPAFTMTEKEETLR
ncbi:MAG: hypothetical protein ACLFWL_18790 [Candidatus Brocadiia bacterium]